MACVLLFLFSAPTAAMAQEKNEYDMGLVQMILLVPTGSRVSPEDSLRAWQAHRAATDSMLSQGRFAFSALASPGDTLHEILVVKSDSLGLAQKLAAELPAVRSGLLEPRYLQWYVARNYLLPAATPFTRISYVFGFLVKGPTWSPEVTEVTKKLQEGHMNNITRLHEAGKLALAGPFKDGGDRRGVFIFRVPTVEEAQALTDTDPAVKAGRLRIELHAVTVPEGMLK